MSEIKGPVEVLGGSVLGVTGLEDRLDSETDRSFIEKCTDWYFAPKSFERSGKLYELLGVRQFKKLVLATAGRLVKRARGGERTLGTYFIGKERNKKTIKQYELNARVNELIHAPVVAFFGYQLAADLGNKNYSDAVADVIPFLINGYATMLQRYNRVRVYNTLDKLTKRTAAVRDTSSN